MTCFLIVDLEATSREPAEAHIVEWGAVIVKPEWFGAGGIEEHGGLVRPPVQIPPETSAVHQIIDSDVSEAPTWEEES
jgi:DNA polymerase III epsilon subunit-like protein